MKKKSICEFLVILVVLISESSYSEEENGIYTIVGSKLLRSNSKYHVFITARNSSDLPQDLDAYISVLPEPKIKSNQNFYRTIRNEEIGNGNTRIIEFDVKSLEKGDYSLNLQSNSTNFNHTVKLNMNTQTISTFVQTDKSKYKPADKVNFRVLVLNNEMRPLEKVKLDIFITDGSSNRIKQFNDLKLTKGVFQGELQLSDLPVLGNWHIHVVCNGKEELSKLFEVAEYTLPKFEVKIDVIPHANLKEGKIRASVVAKYTFGKVAKGNATIFAKVGFGVKVLKTIDVNAKESVEFDIKNELKIDHLTAPKDVELFATFREELTEREMNATAVVTVHRTPYKINLIRGSESFKPGLPFKVFCRVSRHDKNSPITDDRNPVTFKIEYQHDTVKTCEYEIIRHRYYPESQSIEKKTVNCKKLEKRVENQEHSVKNGIIELELNIPPEVPSCMKSTSYPSCFEHTVKVEATYRDAKDSLEVKKTKIEDNEYIQIVHKNRKWNLKDQVELDVISTVPMMDLTYQIFARGDVVASETVQVKNAKNFQLKIIPMALMVPKAKIIVFYISKNQKIISDSTEIDFESELGNHVDIEISKNELKPGENISIEISANSNSFVGILVVDQSVLLLGSDNDLQESAVFEDLKKYGKTDKYNTKYISYRSSDFEYFTGQETFLITNAKKYTKNNEYYTTGFHWLQYEHDINPIQYRPYHIYFSQSYPSPGFGGGFGSSTANAAAPSQSFGFYGFSSSFAEPVSTTYPPPQNRPTTYPPSQKKPNFEPPKPIQIRKEFPETWLFESFDLNKNTSFVNFTRKVPDTITSWILTGFAVDPLTGLGITKIPSKLRIFQPFFVTTNLPYSIKRGEVVSIPIIVFNYLESDQEVDVTFFNSEGEFEFTEVTESTIDVRRNRRQLDNTRTKHVLVKSQEGLTLPFMIKPLKVGSIKIKVTASTSIAGDGLEKLLNVEPEGVTRFMNEAMFVDLREKNEMDSLIKISVPSHAVPDSTKIEASAIGDVMGTSLENLDKLIKLPYGCGEQNMLNFVPNIVALDYLISVNKLTPDIKSKATSHMESGYQRELGYKHDDGSYSAFGKGDSSGSTWLTAFVARSFYQASKYIEIDDKIINSALEYLAKVQDDDGHFPEKGRVIHKDMQGGASKGVAMTAYTVLAFLENENASSKYKHVIEKALNYLKTNIDSVKDNYSLAIITYAMQLTDDPIREAFLNKLNLRASKKDRMTFWDKEIPKDDSNNPWNFQPKSVNVEMSAYALQSYVKAGNIVDAIPIMRWLVTQQNGNGGFLSTQDTVVGLQALSAIATKIFSSDEDFTIEITPDFGKPTKLSVNSGTALILHKTKLPADAREFTISTKGKGFGIFQISYQYNLDLNGEWPRFNLETNLDENSNKNFLHLISCTNYIADESSEVSNMAVMEVELPSGFTFDSDSMKDLKSTKNVKKVELENGDTTIVIYFDSLGSENICPEIKAYREHSVAKQKRVSVKVYDYYDNSQKATKFYDPPEISLCDICDGADECKADCEVPAVNLIP